MPVVGSHRLAGRAASRLTLPLVNPGIWLATSAVGAVIGLVLSSSLINLLK